MLNNIIINIDDDEGDCNNDYDSGNEFNELQGIFFNPIFWVSLMIRMIKMSN